MLIPVRGHLQKQYRVLINLTTFHVKKTNKRTHEEVNDHRQQLIPTTRNENLAQKVQISFVYKRVTSEV